MVAAAAAAPPAPARRRAAAKQRDGLESPLARARDQQPDQRSVDRAPARGRAQMPHARAARRRRWRGRRRQRRLPRRLLPPGGRQRHWGGWAAMRWRRRLGRSARWGPAAAREAVLRVIHNI
jgi:hypothetical protein